MDAGTKFNRLGIGDIQALRSDLAKLLEDPAVNRAHFLRMDGGSVEDVLATFGPACRDEVLYLIAERLLQRLNGVGRLYHIAHACFVLLLDDREGQPCTPLVEQLVEALHQPVRAGDIPFIFEPKIGIAQYPDHGDDVLTLIRAAVVATRFAKETNQSHAFYSKQWDETNYHRFRLVTDLARTLEDAPHRVYPHLQPLIELSSGQCIGAEALVRWNRDDYGVLTAGQFLPNIEGTALFRPLTERVLAASLALRAGWNARSDRRHLDLAINLSPSDLQDPDFGKHVKELAQAYDVGFAGIELEVTEEALTQNEDVVKATLQDLKDLGATLALDDYGTGYTSMDLLLNIPFDKLKFDRSLIQGAMRHSRHEYILRSTIGILHELGLRVTAEGIETAEMAAAARNWGCDYAQGYWFTEPLSETDFDAWWRDRDHTSWNMQNIVSFCG